METSLLNKPHDPLDFEMNNGKHFENLLFIGDPHLTSRQVSSRHDIDSIKTSILNKMRFIADLSHEYCALPLIKGDLFDNDKESDIELLYELSEVLQEFYVTPYTLVGNHDKTENVLNKQNMLKYLIDTNQLREIKDNVITIKTMVNGMQVEIGGTHYGSLIPHSVTKFSRKTDKVVWMTHHDLNFGVFYENMQKLHEIQGVDLAVNGHIHMYQNERQHGMTTWCNAGNITRMSRDMEEHIPKVWLWSPQQHDDNFIKLKGIEIPHQKNVFKKLIEVSATKTSDVLLEQQGDKHRLTFTNAAMEFSDDNNATSDKELVEKAIESLATQMNLPDDFINDIKELLEDIDLQ